MSKGYILNRNAKNKEMVLIEYENSISYDVKPKNKVKKSDSIDVTKVMFISPTFIEKILNRKITKEYSEILNLVSLISTDDSDDTGRMIGVLNRIELFKSIIRKKYSKFMLEEQTDKMLKRLNLMGKEIKKRVFEIEEEKRYQEEYSKGGKSR